jgi:hypothetical protein
LFDIFALLRFLGVFFLAVGAGLVSRWLVLKGYRWIGYLLLYVSRGVSSQRISLFTVFMAADFWSVAWCAFVSSF